MAEQGDEIDYSKGLIMLDQHFSNDCYFGDFMVFGRYPKPRYHRINNDRIVTCGDVITM